MMRVLCSVVLIVALVASPALAVSTMSWRFSMYNVPYAEEVALSIAQAQKELNEPEEDPFSREDALQMFKDMLFRQFLSRLTAAIIEEAFGDGDLDLDEGPVSYTLGDYRVDIVPMGSYLSVTLTDLVTGEMTTIEVPYYTAGTSFTGSQSYSYDSLAF